MEKDILKKMGEEYFKLPTREMTIERCQCKKRVR